MALLNKLFFPSSTSTTPSSPTAAAAAATTTATVLARPSSPTQQQQANTLSRTSSLVNILSSSVGASAATATSSPFTIKTKTATSLSLQRNNAKSGGNNKRSNYNQTLHSKNYLSQFPFDGSQVRILVYRECDSRGRRLLFDSNALEKVYLKENNGNISNKHSVRSDSGNADTNSTISCNNNNRKETLEFKNEQQTSNKRHSNGSFIEVCEEYGYKHNRPNSADISSVGEMVFGALAMSFRGTSLKVHWLESPLRLLCSQVFLTPTKQSNGHSPYSTLSSNSLATPRSSICSEHGSMDGVSMNSFSLPFSVGIGRLTSLTSSDLNSSSVSSPLDVPSVDQQSLLTSSESAADSGPRFSSTYSTGNDSGYSALSRGQLSSDQWSSSYQCSTRSSMGSVSSGSERMRKLSIDSSFFPFNSTGNNNLWELSSDGSLQRRISRNIMTSFENENSMNDLIGFVTDSYTHVTTTTHGGSEGINFVVNNNRVNYCPSETRSNPEMGKKREQVNKMKPNTKRARLGLAVCVRMSESFEEEMELYCSEHIALLESMLSRLRANTERAYIHHNQFLQIMFQIWQDTQQWFLDLFTAPRIKCPVWLSITTSGSKYSKNVAERFIKELCWLLSFADTKDTNFFVSTMLTAILTHHLGWVPTVSPFNSSSSTAAIDQRAKLLKVAQKHPYNALWAQLGDLFGAIGLPSKLARTVIYGTEKLSIERLLNVLTYFIRCGEVRRSAKKEDFNKDNLNDIVLQKKNESLKKPYLHSQKLSSDKKSVLLGNQTEGILSRTPTYKQNLNSISMNNNEIVEGGEEDDKAEDDDYDNQLTDVVIRTSKMNEIPTVLAFRDSRFVQQELRIGNYLMDTGIEKNSLPQYQQAKQKELASNHQSEGRIRLTLTTPENVELNVEDTHMDEDGAVEAIEIDSLPSDIPTITSISKLNQAKSKTLLRKKPFLWGMASSTVREGLSLNDLNKIQHCFNKESQQEQLLGEQQENKKSQQLSLSDLITQNSMGKSDRMTWGIEPVKENVSLEEQIHFELSQKNIERDHGICMTKDTSTPGVVFVLGDNEPLVNIKKNTEDLSQTDTNESSLSLITKDNSNNQQFVCPLHRRMHNSATSSHQQLKKHSGVKFNFEQYPQIVTNYMKSKNLLMSNYDLLMDKCSKLELQGGEGIISTDLDKSSTISAPVTAANNKDTFPQISMATTVADNPTNCVVCSGLLNAYQTPSNATELEFETDEVHSFTNINININTSSNTTPSLPTVSSQTSVQTLISSNCYCDEDDGYNINNKNSNESGCGNNHREEISERQREENEENSISLKEGRKKQYNTNQKKPSSQRCSLSPVAAKCAALNEGIHLLKLPIPGIKELQEDELTGDMKLPVGFVPSLFLSVNDHYIPDMVLQGILSSSKKWEMNLREDLALASHSASLISLPAENIAIIADMENWDVKLISSQSQHFPYGGGQSAPVGMSQLVSTMLEAVQAMNGAGISAYECLSFMESKLQEIYLHSETLAAFLLETDFCSLSALTTALNLSENDVPLLLSIASIHTPQISKKCGISFR